MYVHVEVLEGRGCLADIGAHASDRIIVRVGAPESTKGTKGMATEVLSAPHILNTPLGVTLSDKLSAEVKHQVTKRAFKRDLNKHQLRLYTIKHTGGEAPTWLGIVGFKLLYLTDGYVVERWVPMQKATKTESGALRVRVVVRESEADARALLASAALAPHTTRHEGCCCDVCDPDFELAKPLIEVFELDEKHILSNKAGRALSSAMVCVIS